MKCILRCVNCYSENLDVNPDDFSFICLDCSHKSYLEVIHDKTIAMFKKINEEKQRQKNENNKIANKTCK